MDSTPNVKLNSVKVLNSTANFLEPFKFQIDFEVVRGVPDIDL
jgi:hypothetical protein